MVPATHWPLALQHPVGHVLALHVPHVRLAMLHSRPPPQSAFELHPQTPPERHAWPVMLEVQSAHAPPGAPHADAVIPLAHVPEPQQPPMHEPLPAPPQAAVHAPPEQVGVSPPHDEHAAPLAPHVALFCDPVATQVLP